MPVALDEAAGAAPYALAMLSALLILFPVVIALGALLAFATLRRPTLWLGIYAAIVPISAALPFSLPLPEPFGSPSTMVGAILIVVLGVEVVAARATVRVLSPTVPVWLLFTGWAALTVVWSVNVRATFSDLLLLVSLVTLYLLVAVSPFSRRDLRNLEHGALTGGVVVGLYASAQILTGAITTGDSVRLSTGEGSGDPNILAASLMLPIAIALGRALHATSGGRRALYLVSAGIPVVAVVLTASRGALVTMAILLLVLGITGGSRRSALFYGAVPLVVAVAVLALGPSGTLERIVGKGDSSGRSGIWKIAVSECPEYCAFGSGWGTFADVHQEALLNDPRATGRALRFESHNIFIGTGIELGIIGVMLLAAGLWLAIRGAARLPRSVRGPPLAAITALVIANVFLNNLEFKYFWLVLIYAAITIAVVEEEQLQRAVLDHDDDHSASTTELEAASTL